jgi:hypothetical protein
MTITIDDCKEAIKKTTTINPFLSLVSDWKTKKRFKSKGKWVYQVFSGQMDETLYITEHSYGLTVTVEKPGTQWAFTVNDPVDWVGPGDVTFKIYDKDLADEVGAPSYDSVTYINNKLPPGTKEIADATYVNSNFTERNLREIMEALDFVDETPPRDEVLVYPSAALDAELAEAAEPQEETEESITNKKINDILGRLKDWKKS